MMFQGEKPSGNGVKLKVGELTGREDFGRGLARIDSNTMKKIGAKEGDVIELSGKRDTVAIVIRSYPADVGLNMVRVDGLVRKNAGTSIGEMITVRKAGVKEAKKVTLAPTEKGTILHIAPNLIKQNIFMRPVRKGDIIIANPVFRSRGRGGGDIFEQMFGIRFEEVFLPIGVETRLAVVKTDPAGPVQITDMTQVELLREAVEMEEGKVPTVTYEDIGGLKQVVPKIREMIELPLRHPEIFTRLGVEAPKGILLHGPPGCGKTLLAKAVANESGAHFISLAGPEVMSKWYGQSLPYEEEVFVLENNIPKRMPIGEVVENKKKGIRVLSFDNDGKIAYRRVSDLIRHKNKSDILEVITKSGRKIRVTDDHSLFTLNGNRIIEIKTSDIIPGRTYIAVPRFMPGVENQIESIDLLEQFKKEDYGLVVRDVKKYLDKAIKKIGHRQVAEVLGYSDKYFYDVVSKNVGIRISRFMELMERCGIEISKNEIKISSKRKSMPAILDLTEEFCRFLGIWVAEGSFNHKYKGFEAVRLSVNDREIKSVKKLCEGLFGKVTVFEKEGTKGMDVYISSRILGIVLNKVIGLHGGARNKRIPDVIFALDKSKVAAFLKGYYSGDGSVYKNQRGVCTIEAGTESERLANDMMYLLLRFGIVAKKYDRIEENRHQFRICFTGAENMRRFLEIEFSSKEKNKMIKAYINNVSWKRSRQMPITGPTREIIMSAPDLSQWSGSVSLGSAVIDEHIPAYSNLTKNDIFWDRVEKIKKVHNKHEYVYDISVPGCENFLGGFGGIFAHNSEENLRKVFEEAEKNSPAIIFIDEIDSIAPKREDVSGEVERRVVSQLLTMMDGLKARGKVVVIAATNRPNALDPALRRPGRFDREIEIPVPNKKGRKEVLQIHTRHMPLDKSVDVDKIAEITYGFVGADLAALAKEAAMHSLRRVLPNVSALKEGEPLPKDLLEKLQVIKEDFEYAMRMVQPSAMREVLVEVPKVKWSDVGGLDEVKRLLKEAVEWPLKDPDSFKRLGIRPTRGIMMYGPPGCGKTYIVKALANEAGSNFISVKGPELLSKWVGESEQHVRSIFRRAKQVAPCIVFFDEIDALAPRRGLNSGTRVTEQVVSQLLTEMSGIEEMEGVVVISATNRPDIVDPALLRPGRFDRMIYVPAPDEKTRTKILKVHTRNTPLKGVDLEKLAEKTKGYSGADLEALVREAAMFALRDNMKAKEVTKKNFDEALKKVRPSITDDMFAKYQRAVEELKKTKLEEAERATRYIG